MLYFNAIKFTLITWVSNITFLFMSSVLPDPNRPVWPGQWALYISGVRSSGHRVKPNMAVNGGPNLRRLSLPMRSFMFTCIVKMEQGDWNRRNLEPPCPPYLASLFAQSVTGSSHSIYIYIYIYGAHWTRTVNTHIRRNHNGYSL